MTSAVLTIVALIIAFIEKPHLFEKPYKGYHITMVLLLIAAAAISGTKGYLDNEQDDHNAKVIDSLSGSNKQLIAKADKLQYSTDSSSHTIHSMDSFMRAYCKVSFGRDTKGNITYNYYSDAPQKTKMCLIKFLSANKPDKTTVKLCNGDYMLYNYRPHNNGKSITIPYMKGKDYVSGFAIFDNTFLTVEFIKETGTFNIGTGFEFGVQKNGEPAYDSVNFSFLANLPVRE